ncbi:preprotein translocase subunit TatB, partial [Herbaspirillum sp. 3C11]
HALGAARAARWAIWLERHVATIVGNVSLGVLLGMGPVVAEFFGLPLDVRHVTLATGTLVAAGASLGWGIVSTPAFWLAVSGIVVIGALNVGIAFLCAMALALRAREIPARIRRVVFRAVLRRFAASPWTFLFPEKAASAAVRPVPSESETEEER